MEFGVKKLERKRPSNFIEEPDPKHTDKGIGIVLNTNCLDVNLDGSSSSSKQSRATDETKCIINSNYRHQEYQEYVQ